MAIPNRIGTLSCSHEALGTTGTEMPPLGKTQWWVAPKLFGFSSLNFNYFVVRDCSMPQRLLPLPKYRQTNWVTTETWNNARSCSQAGWIHIAKILHGSSLSILSPHAASTCCQTFAHRLFFRSRLSASPATGLLGLPENGFLHDFFGCLGFIDVVSERCVVPARDNCLKSSFSGLSRRELMACEHHHACH